MYPGGQGHVIADLDEPAVGGIQNHTVQAAEILTYGHTHGD